VIFLREHLFEFELDEYRPLGDPTRFLGALATLFSRCKDEDVSPARTSPTPLGLASAAAAATGRCPVPAPRTPAGKPSSPGRYARYQEPRGERLCIEFGDPSVALRAPPRPHDSPARSRRSSRGSAKRLVDDSGHEPCPVGARPRSWPIAIAI
jgi:hypothetical protein